MRLGIGLALTASAISASFTPASLGSKLKGWYREDKTLATGVSQWTDKSGSGNHWTQATGANQPAFSASGGPNGTACIQGDGSSKKMLGPAINSLWAAGAKEAYFVVKLNSIASNDATPMFNDALLTDSSGVCYLTFKTAGPVAMMTLTDGSYDTATATVATGSWMRIRIRHESGTLYIKINNAAEQSVANGNTVAFTDTLNLFYNVSTAAYLNGSIAEAIFCNAALSAAERTNVDTYHASYFGLSV